MDELKIEGLIENITYRNDQNGYTVAVVRVSKSRVTAVGIMPFLSEGETAVFYGKYIVHPTYGEQFSVSTFERTAPKTVGGILRYLSSGIIRGVGPATATRIVERFGEDTLDVISNRPEELALIKGISKDKAMAISEEYNKQYGVRDIMYLLSPYEISLETCVKIFRKMGSEACETIKSNPYILVDSDIGFSFEKAEKIAYDFGVPPDDEMRLASGIEYILKKNLLNGHTCLPKSKVLAVADNLLECGLDKAEEVLDKLVENLRIFSKDKNGVEFLAIPEYAYAEQYIASKLVSIEAKAPRLDPANELEIDFIENKLGIKFEKFQREAIKSVMDNGVTVLTGGPGTGKTTTLNGIIGLLEMRKLDICLAAPTGRAAKRMTELCGRDAKTIHRLLEVDWSDEDKPKFSRNEQNPLESDVVIVDETSMVDALLFDSLLCAMRPKARLVLVGDVDQLPSVSAGNVLNDIISCGKISCTVLSKVFRQARQSAIVNTAHAIIEETPIDFSNKAKDFFFVHKNDGYSVAQTVCDLVSSRLPAAYGYDAVKDIQVICPSKLYETGIANLNNILQEILNPHDSKKDEIVNRGITFREKDKVMQIKNNYNIEWTSDSGESGSGIYNGDVGFITKIDKRNGFVKIRFDDREATYFAEDINEIELAYAITVHKSQGSEFDCVIIPTYNIPQKLRYRNLLYTAVTRAKKMLVCVGGEDVFTEMAQNDKKMLRYTMLKEYLLERL